MSENSAPGPVPVRELMQKTAAEREAARKGQERERDSAEPGWTETEHRFEVDGVGWLARSAGAGSYGTGRTGTARLVAVHFFRADDPELPLREALVAAGAFPHMVPEELRTLLDRATPIELDR